MICIFPGSSKHPKIRSYKIYSGPSFWLPGPSCLLHRFVSFTEFCLDATGRWSETTRSFKAPRRGAKWRAGRAGQAGQAGVFRHGKRGSSENGGFRCMSENGGFPFGFPFKYQECARIKSWAFLTALIFTARGFLLAVYAGFHTRAF